LIKKFPSVWEKKCHKTGGGILWLTLTSVVSCTVRRSVRKSPLRMLDTRERWCYYLRLQVHTRWSIHKTTL